MNFFVRIYNILCASMVSYTFGTVNFVCFYQFLCICTISQAKLAANEADLLSVSYTGFNSAKSTEITFLLSKIKSSIG